VVNGVRTCPLAGCIDLSQYSFMKSDLCLCNSPLLVTMASQAGDARMHLVRALIGAQPPQAHLGCFPGHMHEHPQGPPLQASL
jgi:hypothetical protein